MIELDTVFKAPCVLICNIPERAEKIPLFDMMSRLKNAVIEFSVVSEQQKPFGIDIEPTDRDGASRRPPSEARRDNPSLSNAYRRGRR